MIELDERRRRIRDEARAFVRDQVLPVAAELDPRGEDMPWSLIDQLAERGYLGATVPGMQIHGGNGYTSATAAQRYWRDARLTTIFEGTSEIQRRIIADRLLEDGVV